MITMRRSVLAAAALLALLPIAAIAQEPATLLAPSGKLRSGLYVGTPTSILPEQPGQERVGVGYEIGKELAARLGVPYEPVVFPNNNGVLDAIKSGKVDTAFTNASPARAKEMDFAQPYLDIELGYLAPKGSPVTSVETVDIEGRRIGVTTGSSSDGVLSSALKKATVVRVDTFPQVIEMLKKGELDAFATNKATLFELSEKVPNSAVLDGRWGLERHAIAIPKGREAALPFLRAFTDDIRAKGLVTAAAKRAGLRGALTN